MFVRTLQFEPGAAGVVADFGDAAGDRAWLWIDIEGGPEDIDELADVTAGFGLEEIATRDALEDLDLPKVDDFGQSLLLILHALGEESIATFAVNCFLTESRLITIRPTRSASIDALWEGAQHRPELAAGRPDDMLARLADVLTRRLVGVLDVFDARNEELIERALATDPSILGEIIAVRSDLNAVRRVVHPQREALDVMRHSGSVLLSDRARRRFSDVFDAATRAADGLDAARSALSETLEAYRGAEAKQATEVTKVLTFYAAVMLPLSLVVGFFGMNFQNLPLVERDNGWIIVSAFMGLVALLSLGVFISLGWARRPSGRRAGAALGRGLVEAARTPVELVGALYEISTMPVRGVAARRPKPRTPPDQAQRD